MQEFFGIITCSLFKNLMVSTVFLWILCESREILGTSSDADFVQAYTRGINMQTTGGVAEGYSDLSFDHFRREKLFIPSTVWLFMTLVVFFFVMLCMCFCVFFYMRRRYLRRNINTPLPRSEASRRVPQEELQISVITNDPPPDYTVVVDQKTTVPSNNYSLNQYPKVLEGKKLETPPPAYITVAPFK